MDETLTPVNEGQEGVEGLQTESEVVIGESVSAEPAEQQTTEAEPRKQTPEENAQYKALRLQEKQSAVDAEYAELGKQFDWRNPDGSPVKTKSEFMAARDAYSQMASLMEQGYTEDAARLKVERDQLAQEKTERMKAEEQRIRSEQENMEFLQYFESVNKRKFDPSKDVIPPEVWASNLKGVPLRFAYAEALLQQKLQKELSLETGKKTAEINAANAASSTGSVIGNGAANNAVLTEEIINAMSDKQRMARWGDIKKFYNMK